MLRPLQFSPDWLGGWTEEDIYRTDRSNTPARPPRHSQSQYEHSLSYWEYKTEEGILTGPVSKTEIQLIIVKITFRGSRSNNKGKFLLSSVQRKIFFKSLKSKSSFNYCFCFSLKYFSWCEPEFEPVLICVGSVPWCRLTPSSQV